MSPAATAVHRAGAAIAGVRPCCYARRALPNELAEPREESTMQAVSHSR